MSAPRVYGWCPGALRPMMSGDGLVVRVRAPMGRLSQEQARGLARLSETLGNGLIDLSARANLQLRGLREDDHPALLGQLQELGLLDADLACETRRNLVIAPFWTHGDTTETVARSLTEALAAPDAPDLPGKFGFAVDCGAQPVLAGTSADIRIEQGAEGLICRPDGAETGLTVTKESTAEAALQLARWFLETGGAPDGRGRMAAHIARRGLPDACTAPRLTAAAAPEPGANGPGVLVGLEFGQIRAETLARLAEAGPLRLTPWRMLLIEGTPELPDLPDLITKAQDPRLGVSACTGAPGCLQAQAETRALARQLATRVSAPLHVSGCAKGCAHPGPAALTLVATGENEFDLIHNGRTTDTPARTGLTHQDLLSGEL